MNISVNWIKEFTAIPDLSPMELMTRFTMATCEVEAVITTGEIFSKVRVAEIKSIRKHPDADTLNLVTVDTGTEKKEVVCGAPNVKTGMKVPYAPLGTTFPAGFTLEPKKIRGIVSEGMLCAPDELGISDDHSGLMELPQNAPVGKTLAETLGLQHDTILEIDNKSITHRPDLWGHYGMAREFSAVFGNPLKNPYDDNWLKKMEKLQNSATPPITVKVDKDSSCLGFYGISMANVTVRESPRYIQERLSACGMRPINNIVDISNYVMLELGIPNHIFNRDKIGGGKIIIRRTGSPQKFVTLDEQERDLIETDTVVCDAEKPLSIAGIMGGLDSGISDDTARIFIEAANWDAGSIRKTTGRLGLRTDASQRYEKSLDTRLLLRTVHRIVELILESCPEAKIDGPAVMDGIIERPVLTVETSAKRISDVLGKNVPEERIIEILTALDFKVEKRNGRIHLTVPSYRSTKDVECEADIVEEIGRITGFDHIEPQPPVNKIEAVRLSESSTMMRQIRDFMVYHGRAYEIMTYPFIGEKLLERASWPAKNDELVLINALTPEHERMRPSLIPSLLEAAALNQKTNSGFRMFELGRSFRPDPKIFSEDLYQLGIVYFDRDKSLFMDMLNTVEGLLNNLNLPARIVVTDSRIPAVLLPKEWPGCHPQIMGRTAGFITSVHPLVLRNFKIKGNAVLAILDITEFKDKPRKTKTGFTPLPRFPFSSFDCTVVTDKRTAAADALVPVKALKMKELEWVKIADIYELNETQKTVTLRISFLDREKTLSREFLKQAEDSVVKALADAGFPLKVME